MFSKQGTVSVGESKLTQHFLLQLGLKLDVVQGCDQGPKMPLASSLRRRVTGREAGAATLTTGMFSRQCLPEVSD